MTGLWARVVALVAVVVAASAGAGGYVVYEHREQAQARTKAPAVATRSDVASVAAQPHLVFRSTALGQGYGQVALAQLAAPDGPRAFTPASCDRVYATSDKAICLSADRGLVTTYHARLLTADWQPYGELPLTGIPNRARLSRDGSLVATTTFVHGDSYANPGKFSTRTVVSRTDGTVVGDIEKFALIVNGSQITAADRNLWGVTFVDDDRFYATAASGKKTWLVEGSIRARRMSALREDAECPSLSPDGTRIAFKRHGNLAPGQWRLAVYDPATRSEIRLAETRSVDDQVEWLDNHTVIYGLPRHAAGTATSDVWRVPADGRGAPQLLIHDAWSPAVVR